MSIGSDRQIQARALRGAIVTRFGTAGIRGPVQTEVTPDLALRVGWAVGRDAAVAGESTIVVGRDGRTTGPGLVAAAAAGAMSAGVDVLDIGAVPTPTVGFASRGKHAIAVTASHNPPTDNGMKLFVDGVEYDEALEQRVSERLETGHPPVEWDTWGKRRKEDRLDAYRMEVREYARSYGTSLDGMRIAVDTGNGVAGLTTPQILRELGAAVVTLNGNVDGHFSGRQSKPTRDALSDLRAFLAEDEADLGIAHDGDGDRVVVVDDTGNIIHEDTVLAILGHHFVSQSDSPDPVVVTTPNASERIDQRVEAAGGRTERVGLGAIHEGIAAVEESGGAVVFAGEPWKHVHPRLGGWIDGSATAAVFARLVADSGLAALRDPIQERPYRKVSVDCPNADKDRVMDQLQDRLPDALPTATVRTSHGIRLTRPDGSWVLVRPSGTEPKIRLYVEANDVDELTQTMRDIITDVIAGTNANT